MKKLLLSLFGIITLGLNFGCCDNVSSYIDDILLFSGTLNYSDMTSSYPTLFDYGEYGSGTYCINFVSIVRDDGNSITGGPSFNFGFANSGSNPSNKYMIYSDQIGNWICLYGNKPYLNLGSKYRNNFTYKVFKLSDLLNHSVGSSCDYSDYVSLSIYNECVSDLSSCNSLLSGYSNALDSCSNSYNSCSSSLNSCLQANCPDVDIPLNTFSNVYVYSDNNYFPLTGTSNIYVNLPSFLGYTYNYTNNGSDLDIDVENNGDEEYIQSIMDINSYRPTSEDFTDIFVSGLTLVMPYIVVVLFIVFIWKLIKKIFK